MWIPDHVEVWRAAEITRGYREGDAVLHLRLEDGSVRLELCSPAGPSCAPHGVRNPQEWEMAHSAPQTSLGSSAGLGGSHTDWTWPTWCLSRCPEPAACVARGAPCPPPAWGAVPHSCSSLASQNASSSAEAGWGGIPGDHQPKCGLQTEAFRLCCSHSPSCFCGATCLCSALLLLHCHHCRHWPTPSSSSCLLSATPTASRVPMTWWP